VRPGRSLELLQARLKRGAEVGPAGELVFEPQGDLPDILRLEEDVDVLSRRLHGDVAKVWVVRVMRESRVRFLQGLEGLARLEKRQRSTLCHAGSQESAYPEGE
jgi:hypothetical protein